MQSDLCSQPTAGESRRHGGSASGPGWQRPNSYFTVLYSLQTPTALAADTECWLAAPPSNSSLLKEGFKHSAFVDENATGL